MSFLKYTNTISFDVVTNENNAKQFKMAIYSKSSIQNTEVHDQQKQMHY